MNTAELLEKFRNQWYDPGSRWMDESDPDPHKARVSVVNNSGWRAIQMLKDRGMEFEDVVDALKEKELIRVFDARPRQELVQPGQEVIIEQGFFQYKDEVLSSYKIFYRT